MEVQELRDKASKLKMEKQAILNDTFFWVQLAREAVEQLPDTRFEFEVPNTRKSGSLRTVARNNGKSNKERILTKDIVNSAFVSMVAIIEDYLSKIMTWILLCDNQRIKCTVSGVNFSKDISIIELIDNKREDIIINIINQRVEGLFYANPSKQLEYFDKALDLKVDDDEWGKWIEIKARRDLWIHNAGVVNQIYLNKAGKYKLCELGSEAIISEEYFHNCVSMLKSMMGHIDHKLRKTYHD